MIKLDIQHFGGRGASSGGSSSKEDSFNNFRFKSMKWLRISNNYITVKNRVNKSEDKIIVKVGDNHLKKTTYGYALILDQNNVVFVKDWQVSQNYYGNEVLLTKQYFNPRRWGEHNDFSENKDNLTWGEWLKTAKEQKNTPVKWEDGKNAKKKYINRLKYGG